MSASAPDVVRAAGGVLWRPGPTPDPASVEVLVVRRPAPHDDWSLPKGKLDPGERHRDAALREVHEETGVRAELGAKLAEVSYGLPDGRRKVVRFWEMRELADDGFDANDEIVERRWVPLADVDALLSWDSDRSVVAEFRRGGVPG